jgi:hypothetical protein
MNGTNNMNLKKPENIEGIVNTEHTTQNLQKPISVLVPPAKEAQNRVIGYHPTDAEPQLFWDPEGTGCIYVGGGEESPSGYKLPIMK